MSEFANGRDAAVLISGGVDSAVLVVELLREYERVWPIHVRFGLRWEQSELAGLRAYLAAVGASRPGIEPLTVLDEPIGSVYGDHWSGAGRPGVPGADTEDDAVYLPGRNALLVTKAAVWCRVRGVDALALGILSANPFPDGSAAFFDELTAALNLGMDGRLEILRPYVHMSKVDVIRRGRDLPLHLTLSCLDPVRGGHCGACNKCEERRSAFRAAGVPDLTRYAAGRVGAA